MQFTLFCCRVHLSCIFALVTKSVGCKIPESSLQRTKVWCGKPRLLDLGGRANNFDRRDRCNAPQNYNGPLSYQLTGNSEHNNEKMVFYSWASFLLFLAYHYNKGGIAGPDAPKMQALPKLG